MLFLGWKSLFNKTSKKLLSLDKDLLFSHVPVTLAVQQWSSTIPVGVEKIHTGIRSVGSNCEKVQHAHLKTNFKTHPILHL